MGLKVEKWHTNRSLNSSQKIDRNEMIMVYQKRKVGTQYKMAMTLSICDQNHLTAMLAGGGVIDVEVNYK